MIVNKINKLVKLTILLFIMLTLGACSKSESDGESIDETTPPTIDEEVGSDDEVEEFYKLNEIELYLDMIHKENIDKVWYSSYSNITQYFGYMFFYDGKSLNIQEEIVDSSYTKTRPGIKRDSIDYIVIHDTGNNNSKAGAASHSSYINNNPGVSWHYTVDMNEIYHQIPNDEVAYHAGDGLRKSGSTYYNTTYKKTSITGGNMNGIGIETCVNSGSDYGSTLFNTAILVSELLIEYDLEISDVKKHYDFSGKTCPKALIQSGYWEEFISYVEICYYYKTKLSDVSFEFIGNEMIDNQGRVNKFIERGSTITYKVVVSYNGKSLEYTFNSQIN